MFSYHHIPTNSVAPFCAWKHAHNPQFLHSLWQRADAQNISFETLYVGQFVSSTQLIILNYLVILSHWRNTRVSLETYIPYYSILRLHGWQLDLVAWIKNGFWHNDYILVKERMVRLDVRNWASTVNWTHVNDSIEPGILLYAIH